MHYALKIQVFNCISIENSVSYKVIKLVLKGEPGFSTTISPYKPAITHLSILPSYEQHASTTTICQNNPKITLSFKRTIKSLLEKVHSVWIIVR